jgi:hypothetical protein
MKQTLVKWDASVVGDTPPIGRWLNESGQTLKVTSHQPRKIVQRLAAVLGRRWEPGVDAASLPGCLEVIHIEPGKAPETVFQRTQ